MKLKIIVLLLSITGFVEFADAQDTVALLNLIANRLVSREITVSDALCDPSYMSLHSLVSFRNIIRENAKMEKIKITSANEPGNIITIKGAVTDSSGNPQADKLVYIYQTSARGWYADTAAHILKQEGDRRHARLFGYFRTDTKGLFEFETIKPHGYPNSTLPAHIHIEVALRTDNSVITELQFDDDPRLTGETRARSVREQFLIEKNRGTAEEPLYVYRILTRK